MNKFNHYYLAAILTVAGAFSCQTTLADKLPDLGNEYRATLSVEDERLIGNNWMQQIRAAGMVYPDQLVNEYIQHLGNKLTKFVSTPYLDKHIQFFAINDKSINAFAFFGGHIAVHSGLILISETESELAGVMAHELGHIAQEHVLRQITESKRMMPVTLAQSLAAIVVGRPELLIPVLAGHGQHMLNFSRQHEQEADRLGMQILARAQFDPHGLPDMFERMSTSSRYRNKPPEYLLSHPVYESRISDTKHRADAFVYKQNTSSTMFHLIRARLLVQNTDNLQQLLSEYQHKLQTKRHANELANTYGYAYALHKSGKTVNAWQLIQPLLSNYPEDIIIQMTAAEMELELQQASAAQARLEKLLRLYPDSYSLSLQYIELLLQTKQAKQAHQELARYKTMHALEPIFYEQLRQAASMLGNQTEVYTANAEWYVLCGDLDSALRQLELASSIKTNNAKTNEQIAARSQQLTALQKKLKAI